MKLSSVKDKFYFVLLPTRNDIKCLQNERFVDVSLMAVKFCLLDNDGGKINKAL